jgi:catechol 2,3-dioxygenase-like lactoylglutathione lyase family enzyme
MGGFDILGIDHVTVTAPDELMEETLAWYRDTLGLVQLDKPEGTRPVGAWFSVGGHELHVSQDPHNPPRTAHFGIVVSDFDAAIDKLRSAGHHIEQATEIPGRQRFYTRDPAGNRIEIAHFEEEA